MRRSKSKDQQKHFKRRALERFGLHVDKNQYAEIIRMIQAGEGKFVEKQSKRVTVWELEIDDETMRVVYDKHRKTVVTALWVKEEQ